MKWRRRRVVTIASLCVVAAIIIGCCAQTITSPQMPESADPMKDRIIVLDQDQPALWKTRLIASKPPTQYEWMEHQGERFLRSNSDSAASMLIRHLSFDPNRFRFLEWRWRVFVCPEGEDLTRKSGNDCPARVLVGFKGDWSKAGYFERRAVQEEISKSGYEPPGFLLVYIWSSNQRQDACLDDPHVGQRAKVIVVNGVGSALGCWHSHRRNLIDDFRKAFGADPPEVISVAIMTDTDDTHSHAQADYSNIQASMK